MIQCTNICVSCQYCNLNYLQCLTGPVVFLLFPATVLTAKHRRTVTWVASLILNFIIIDISIGLCTQVSRTKVSNLYLKKLMFYWFHHKKNSKRISRNLWNSSSFRGVDLSKSDNGKPVDLPTLVLLLYQNSSSSGPKELMNFASFRNSFSVTS